jgi:hypothetical protein
MQGEWMELGSGILEMWIQAPGAARRRKKKMMLRKSICGRGLLL